MQDTRLGQVMHNGLASSIKHYNCSMRSGDAKKLANWELAWSKDANRWYYQDRISGDTAWKKPVGCHLDAEAKKPPKGKTNKEPALEPELAEGWEALWDPQKNKYYFYNEATQQRSWFVPRAPPPPELSPPETETEPSESDDESDQESDMPGMTGTVSGAPSPRAPSLRKQKSTISRGSLQRGSTFAGTLSLVATRLSAIGYGMRNSVTGPASTGLPAVSRAQALSVHTSAKKKQKPFNSDLTQLLWDADTYVERLRENASFPSQYKKCLAELKEGNEAYIKFVGMNIPTTTRVSFHECQQAAKNHDVEPYDTPPIITMSHVTMAEATAFFALDSRRVVVCLNFSSGRAETIGGGYLTGHLPVRFDYEGDLCRRVPNLYPSLEAASEEGLYPFGPVTHQNLNARAENHYSSVLYTPSVSVEITSGLEIPGLGLVRGGIDRGFGIYPRELQQRRVGVVSAAAPQPRIKGESSTDVYDHKQIANTLTTIFMAPVIEEPRVTTLVLGLWGVGESANPELMATLYGEAIARGRSVLDDGSGQGKSYHVMLGNLYHEIHFAVPVVDETDEKKVEGFLRGLRKSGVDPKGIDALGGSDFLDKAPRRI